MSGVLVRVLVAAGLGAYFAWVCLEMASYVRRGDRMLAEVAVAAVAGLLAGGVGAYVGRKNRTHG